MKKYRIKTSNDNPRLAIHHDDIIELEELPEKETLDLKEKIVNDLMKHGVACHRCALSGIANTVADIARTHFMENTQELGLIGKVENMVSKEKVLECFHKTIDEWGRRSVNYASSDNLISNIRKALEAL